MRLLVVGGSGFIGRRVRAVARRGGADCFWTSVGVPDDRDAGWFPLDLTRVPVIGLHGIITKLRPDAVVNCAGRLSGPREALLATNVFAVGALVDALARSKQPARLVHLGSAAEYGPIAPGTSAGEEAPAEPTTLYGATKLSGTRLVVEAVAGGGVEAVVLRVFNPIGRGVSPGSVVGKAADALRAAARSGSRTIRLGSLDAHRDYLHVDDVADAIVEAAAHRCTEPILNVGRGTAVQTRALVRTLAGIAGFEGEIVEDGQGSPRSNDVAWQQADVGRIERVLGWRATTDLRLALTDAFVCPGAPVTAG